MQPYPFYALNLAKFFEQPAQRALAVEIYAIIGNILSNYHKLLYPLCSKVFSLLHQLFYRYGDVLAPHSRNGAIGAMPVATLRDFKVSIMLWSGKIALPAETLLKWNAHSAQHLPALKCSKEAIHLRNLLYKLFPIALRETSKDQYL